MKYSLEGIDGNAFCIMAYVVDAMCECKFSKSDCANYLKAATSGDYNDLLHQSLIMIEKCNEINYFITRNI